VKSVGSVGDLNTLTRAPSPINTLTPDELYQCAVAGQSIQDGLLAPPFPHLDFHNEEGHQRFDFNLRQALQPQPDHGYSRDCSGISVIQSLHQQHLAVMTTILHRLLLEKDHVRASTALGMLLRDEIDGKPVDIREAGRWSIGAEILAHQDAEIHLPRREPSPPPPGQRDELDQKTRARPTRTGFEAAKKYYENLIVQYPFQKRDPSAVSASDFYAALFRLWISVVHQEARLREAKSNWVKEKPEQKLEDDIGYRHALHSPNNTNPFSKHQVLELELEQASEIADRMDSIMQTYPYREDSVLQELERSLHLWIKDLKTVSAMGTEEQDAISD
jgi:hypothetical protein